MARRAKTDAGWYLDALRRLAEQLLLDPGHPGLNKAIRSMALGAQAATRVRDLAELEEKIASMERHIAAISKERVLHKNPRAHIQKVSDGN